MDLALIRRWKTDESTIGELIIAGTEQPFCFVLEDKVRTGPKVYGKTAIPAGKYEIVISYSNRFKKYLPLLINVPGFEGIRIHPGNTAIDTEGCLLPGFTKGENFVGDSRKAFNALFAKMKAVEKKEKITILIID